MNKKPVYENIPKELFSFVDRSGDIHDQKFDTKQISYFRDAFNRFCKNKSSVVAAIILLCLVLYAILVPMFCETNYSLSLTDTNYLNYTKLAPKSKLLSKIGIMDGTKSLTLSEANKIYVEAIGAETGFEVIKKVTDTTEDANGKIAYVCDVDTYIAHGKRQDLKDQTWLMNATHILLGNAGGTVKSDFSKFWRTRNGTADEHTSFTIAYNLAMAAKMAGAEVDYSLVWAAPHGDVDGDGTGSFVAWVHEIVK